MEVIGLEQDHKSNKVLSAISYFSVFFAPIILPLIVWILANKPTSTHGRKALFNHIWVYLCYFISKIAQIWSKEVYDKPFDNPDMLSNVSIIVGIIFFILAIILFILNIIRGIKLLLAN